MNTNQQITILMAVYNGEKYIREQLDSLLAQTYTNWQLIIRDDHSSDRTAEIVKEYMNRHTNISLVIKDKGGKGACANFAELFAIARHDPAIDYIMFCDQDDIWKPEKIAATMAAMQEVEQVYHGEPVLIYGDFELMTGSGEYTPGEFRLLHHLCMNNLLNFNFVYGCTTMLNRPLMNKIEAIPHQAINHDYWVALVAAIYHSRYMPDKLLRYRQHTTNASGNVAGNNNLASRIKRNLLSPAKEIGNLEIRLHMFAEFYVLKHDELSFNDREIIKNYLQAFGRGRWQVAYVMLKNRIFRKGVLQTLASFAQILFFFQKLKIKKQLL